MDAPKTRLSGVGMHGVLASWLYASPFTSSSLRPPPSHYERDTLMFGETHQESSSQKRRQELRYEL